MPVDLLSILYERGILTDLDLHFARLMSRLSSNYVDKGYAKIAGCNQKLREELELAAALASNITGQGGICVNLQQWVTEWKEKCVTGTTCFSPPPIDAWLENLHNSPVVGYPSQWKPLILDHKSRLYMYRYWRYESQLSEDLLERARAKVDHIDEQKLQSDLNWLFPRPPQLIGPDWQRVAAVIAVLKRICIISGGPGTGKTSTVLRILALLSGQIVRGRRLRIALAAPTGKAAIRLQQLIRTSKPRLSLSVDQAAQIPEQVFTLHRLLGSQTDSVYFRYNRDNQLPFDVLVIDEVSMVGLALMAKTIRALPPDAHLILLGDKEQLSSVEAGAVLGDICANAGQFSPDFQAQLTRLTGELLPVTSQQVSSSLADTVVFLQHSFRFSTTSGIGALSQAVNLGQIAKAMGLLTQSQYSGDDIECGLLRDHSNLSNQIEEQIVAGFSPYLKAIQRNTGAVEVLENFERFRVLCAMRHGSFGVLSLNRICEVLLRKRGLLADNPLPWYVGRPVMIMCNDYNLKLFNGDVGITLLDPTEPVQLKVFFLDDDGSPRSVHPSRLPEHETAYAMTIHKSQGSEFDSVLVLTSKKPSPFLSRELIYTALTRAKHKIILYYEPAVFEVSIGQRLRCSSGLRDKLLSPVLDNC
jgi:exodeoxyribonuclease V alpha subunit